VSPKIIGIGLFTAGAAVAAVGGLLLSAPVQSPVPLDLSAPPAIGAVERSTTEASVVAEPAAPVQTAADTAPPNPGAEVPVSRPAATMPPPASTAQASPAEISNVVMQSTPPVATPPPPTDPEPIAPPPSVPPGVAAVEREPQRYVPEQASALVVPPSSAPELIEVTVEEHSVIGIRLDHVVSSLTARVEDRVTATVSRDVEAQDRIAITQGTRLEGTIVAVEAGGKFRERPRLGLRFDTLILGDGTRLAIDTDTIYREGDSPAVDATARVGTGAVAGAILGAVLGGKKGAVIGGAAGAAGGAATVTRGEVELRAGAPLTVRLTDDLVVLVRR
jgi:hypothetical protein